MELWQLRTFREIAETLNFTKASENLYLTQSAVSHQIKALEDELGVRLFIRGARGVTLTDAGEAALEHAVRILEEAEKMRQSVAERESSIVGRVRVAAATQALVHLFAPLFEEFMDAHSQVDLVFRTTPSTEQTIDDILNGIADIGFASLPVYSPNLEVEELFEDELSLVVGPKHRFAGIGTVSAKQLEGERWILFERGASIRRASDRFFKKLSFEPEMALESNDTYFIKLMIEHGLGISLIPSWAVQEEIFQGKLASAKIKGHKLKRSVAMVSLKGNPSAPIREFAKFVIENKAELGSFASGK
jgi:DNA-binding transcriptional LysR family regulator